MSGALCCCNPPSSPRVSSRPVDTPQWSRRELTGLALTIFSVAIIILAICFSQGAFDKMMHISSSNLAAGFLGIGSLFFLIPGLVILFDPCGKNPPPRVSRRRGGGDDNNGGSESKLDYIDRPTDRVDTDVISATAASVNAAMQTAEGGEDL